MKFRLAPLAFCLTALASTGFANSQGATQNNAQINALEAKLAALQQEVQRLRVNAASNPQLVALDNTQNRQLKIPRNPQKNNKNNTQDIAPSVPASTPSSLVTSTSSAKKKPSQKIAPATGMGSEIEGPTDLPTQGPLYLPVDLDVPGQSFVSSGPYIGVPLEFTGGHLIVNSPSINEDITLLQIEKNIDQRLKSMGRPAETLGSHILLSGMVEGQGLFRSGGGQSSQSDIDLTSVNLDAYVLGPSTWTSAFIEFSYDNNIGTQSGAFSSNDRVLNARVFVNKAFIVLGDFEKSPLYASFGQMFVPFGLYSSTLVSAPLTRILARTPARALVMGYQQQHSSNVLLATAYIFNGPTHASSSTHVDNGGINLAYTLKGKQGFAATLGAGVIANIADSSGMQFTGNNNSNPPLFGGFGGPTETYTNNLGVVVQVDTGIEKLVHRVPAYDVNLKVSAGNFIFISEYITASTSFNPQDMTFNAEGARPQALHLEGVYNIPWFVNPTSISLSYQSSKEGLAIGLPAKRYSMAINRSFWKNTLQTLEFRRDIDYKQGDTSSGSGIAGPTGTGKFANLVTLQFDYYF